ncbi:nucleotidyltransferase domain-containing protein [Phenylobacterium sp.]|jgi:hypothetical protein|uniref:nucleotidyltransferase domain-containing protein n=1 Tax=Phenylobacterium sp. TaxID=1871053 RepID=UPI002E3079CC|nr:nucleotidyltransferase domain-containing protein [Phenylobacterium sp.]HEX2561670.1 nucleotidyltransferase domain-containing protein [Phenylobacterium sp.]
MAKLHHGAPELRAWTAHDDLNDVLHRWLVGLHTRLGDNLVGAYLHGSLAVGDFDEASDVDFLVVLRDDIPAAEIGPVHDLHRDLCALPSRWARNFEGSYAPALALRRLSTEPRDPPGEPRPDGVREPGMWRPGPHAYPFWFVSEDEAPVRREYDNCQMVRWVLRDKGVRLVGPPATELIDPVGDDDVRDEAAQILVGNLARLSPDLAWFRSAYGQASGVLICARALESLATGEVRSKRSAVAFAQRQLKPRWAKLVEAAFTERARSVDPQADGPPEPHAVEETLAFGRWAAEQAAHRLA